MAQINARNKGHQFELYVRNVFRALGYMQCKTSRSCNRELDAAGVDLVESADTWCSAKLLSDQWTCTNFWTGCQRQKALHPWSFIKRTEKAQQSPCSWQIFFCWLQLWKGRLHAHFAKVNCNERSPATIQGRTGAATCRTRHAAPAIWQEQQKGKDPGQADKCNSQRICCSQEGHAEHHTGRVETRLGQKTGMG